MLHRQLLCIHVEFGMLKLQLPGTHDDWWMLHLQLLRPGERRRQGRTDRRSTEISAVIRNTLEQTIITELLPNSQIDIHVQVCNPMLMPSAFIRRPTAVLFLLHQARLFAGSWSIQAGAGKMVPESIQMNLSHVGASDHMVLAWNLWKGICYALQAWKIAASQQEGPHRRGIF